MERGTRRLPSTGRSVKLSPGIGGGSDLEGRRGKWLLSKSSRHGVDHGSGNRYRAHGVQSTTVS